MSGELWVETVPLADVDRKELRFAICAGAEVRKRIAMQLDLVDLSNFEADAHLSGWLDGARLTASWSADLVQACCVTLEDVPARLSGRFEIRVLPAESPNAPHTETEAVLDPLAEDPPDVLEGDIVPLGEYLIEHLALALDTFPRKPGAVFVAPPEPAVITPFAALKGLQTRNPSSDGEGER